MLALVSALQPRQALVVITELRRVSLAWSPIVTNYFIVCWQMY